MNVYTHAHLHAHTLDLDRSDEANGYMRKAHEIDKGEAIFVEGKLKFIGIKGL